MKTWSEVADQLSEDPPGEGNQLSTERRVLSLSPVTHGMWMYAFGRYKPLEEMPKELQAEAAKHIGAYSWQAPAHEHILRVHALALVEHRFTWQDRETGEARRSVDNYILPVSTLNFYMFWFEDPTIPGLPDPVEDGHLEGWEVFDDADQAHREFNEMKRLADHYQEKFLEWKKQQESTP